MNKQQLAQKIAERTGLTKKQMEEVLDTMTDIITDTIIGGEEVTLAGFGEFSARTRKGRIGVNPQNPSEAITIPAVKVPKFKAGSRLKKSVKTNQLSDAKQDTNFVSTPKISATPIAEPNEPTSPSPISTHQESSTTKPNSFVAP